MPLVRSFTILLLSAFCAVCSAQNADSLCLAMMTSGDGLSLQRLIMEQDNGGQNTQQGAMSKEVTALCKAYVRGCMGDARRAASDMRRALKRGAPLLDEPLMSRLTFGMALQQQRAGKHRKAAKTLRRYLSDRDSFAMRATFEQYEQLFRAYASRRMWRLNRHDAMVPFRLDSVGQRESRSVAVLIPAEVNGRKADFMLDTGATLNVVSRGVADSLNLEPLGVSVSFDGMGKNSGSLALAKRISMGNLVIENVPFCVIANPPSSAAHLHAILGQPLLEALGVVQLDFQRKQLISSADDRQDNVSKASYEANLSCGFADNGLRVEAWHHGRAFGVIPDTGATHSALSTADAPAQRDYIVSNYPSREVVFVGWGGQRTGREYLYPQYDVKIGATVVSLPMMYVFDGADYDSRLGMDFFSRCERVTFYMRYPMSLRVISRK